MSWYTPYCPKLTLMSYRPARLLASDLFPDFPVQIFSKISLSVACRFRIHTTEDCIFVSSHSNKPGKVRVWRKCVGLTGLFPTCHGGQLTLKLWVTKQGSHPRSIIWIICFRADTGYQSLEHKYTNWLTHRIPYIHYCKVQYIYLYELTNGFWLTEL
jgi:hypothetical protein